MVVKEGKRMMKIQLSKSPCIPRYAVVIGDEALWDSDCASNDLEVTRRLAKLKYPGEEIIEFGDQRHYSQQL